MFRKQQQNHKPVPLRGIGDRGIVFPLVNEYVEALQWCSGSADFAPGGKARRGWLKLCAPLLMKEPRHIVRRNAPVQQRKRYIKEIKNYERITNHL